MSDPLAAARAALQGEPAWLVGGAVRDRLLGRPVFDFDVVLAGSAEEVARAVARGAGGAVFALSDAFGAWRVTGPGRAWQLDLMALEGDSIETDLGRRDFTVNAIAEPLAGGDPVDPFGGRDDLDAGRLRAVSDEAIAADPLRALRLARLACELGFAVDAGTAAWARSEADRLAEVAAERVFAELKRVVCADAALDGLRLMDELALTPVVLPELSELRGVDQSDYHHLDVYDHTLAVLREAIALEREPETALGDSAAAAAALLSEPLADELTRGQALRFGALLHDAAKPRTRSVTPEGRVTFLGHDRAGADMARGALSRLRASEKLRSHVAALTRHHLRLGFLVHERPLSPRAVHAYLRACEPVEADVTILSVADRLATRGRRADEAIAAHLELAQELLAHALAWREHGPPAPLIRGHDLARALGIAPGPEIGRLLASLEEAQFAGEVSDADEAVALARRLLGN